MSNTLMLRRLITCEIQRENYKMKQESHNKYTKHAKSCQFTTLLASLKKFIKANHINCISFTALDTHLKNRSSVMPKAKISKYSNIIKEMKNKMSSDKGKYL